MSILKYLAFFVCMQLMSVSAKAQWTVTTQPTLPQGQIEAGQSYYTTMVLRNTGRSYTALELVDANLAQMVFDLAGYVVPYVYDVSIVNTSSGTGDWALYTLSPRTLAPNTIEVGMPSSANLTVELYIMGKPNLYEGCADDPAPLNFKCLGYPGTTQTYITRFVIYDTNCGMARSYRLIDPNCIIAQANSSPTTVTWLDNNTTALGGSVGANSIAPGFKVVASPLGVGILPPYVNSSCSTGRAARNIASMLATVAAPASNVGFCN